MYTFVNHRAYTYRPWADWWTWTSDLSQSSQSFEQINCGLNYRVSCFAFNGRRAISVAQITKRWLCVPSETCHHSPRTTSYPGSLLYALLWRKRPLEETLVNAGHVASRFWEPHGYLLLERGGFVRYLGECNSCNCKLDIAFGPETLKCE